MTGQQINHLVKMANQIVLNLSAAGDDEEVARQACEHMRKCWSPLMKREMADYLNQQGEGLSPVAYRAVAQLVAPI